MAKKANKAKKAGKRQQPFVLNSTNLKFIEVAFNRVIADLQIIRGNATKPTSVDRAVTRLTKLRDQTGRICPQNWFLPFD